MLENEVFGVRAAVRIYYPGDMHDLAALLADAFEIDGFSIEPEEYEPFEEVGFAEAFGFEAWLSRWPEEDGAWFGLELCTDDSIEEVLHGRMHDISGWLARFVANTCNLPAIAVHERWGVDREGG
ncbi:MULTISPECIES: hypothetical protein [Lysobacter]|uniref:Uncharacterized protein n=1 Tax=Lysobacter firmicutimachus TaxID=1792846 RepID=A0ABU8D1V1_9GAMM|nr:hypothetical protein [Lysobacter antibioticus]